MLLGAPCQCSRSSREVKRITNNAVSPMLSIIAELKLGAPTIRVMQLEKTGFFAWRIARAAEAWAGHNWTSRMLYCWSFHRTAEVGFLFASAVTFVAYGTRAERSAEAGGLMMTYAYVAPFFVSAAFQARTCPQTCTVMGHVPPIDASLFGPAAALGRW